MTMTQIGTIIGPADNGKRMTLDEFELAEGAEGRLYELSRGVVIVTDVPNPPHPGIVAYLRDHLGAYRIANPSLLRFVLGGSECKLLIDPTQAERHPDIACYKTSMPGGDSSMWSDWVPELVIEVVSADSAERDYNEKAEDYLLFGVREYWVVDAMARRIRIHRRRSGRWQIQDVSTGTYTTHLLPGFVLDVAATLAA
jgi:Uma2 family endonuclease